MEQHFLVHLKWSNQKMKNFFLYTFLAFLLVSCGSTNKVVHKNGSSTKISKTADLRTLDSDYGGNVPSSIKVLIKDAEKYLGTPYKYGGNTSSGFDCSGFTVKVFSENDVTLPRRSADQAETGRKIAISSVKPGDLLFFATSGSSSVSHVGIVHDIGLDGEIRFIHASTSKGVIISSLNEKYWNKAFLHAQRVL